LINTNNGNNIDKDISRLRRELKSGESQERRLINALKTGAFKQDYVLNEINRLKQDRENGNKRLDELSRLKHSASFRRRIVTGRRQPFDKVPSPYSSRYFETSIFAFFLILVGSRVQ